MPSRSPMDPLSGQSQDRSPEDLKTCRAAQMFISGRPEASCFAGSIWGWKGSETTSAELCGTELSGTAEVVQAEEGRVRR